MDEEKVIIKNENGEEFICDVLFKIDSKETNKSYMVYTDNSKDENGVINIYASIYQDTEEGIKLSEIETESEWNMLEVALETLKDRIREKSESESRG